MEQACAGNRAALESLLRRHRARLYAVCRRITGSDADAALSGLSRPPVSPADSERAIEGALATWAPPARSESPAGSEQAARFRRAAPTKRTRRQLRPPSGVAAVVVLVMLVAAALVGAHALGRSQSGSSTSSASKTSGARAAAGASSGAVNAPATRPGVAHAPATSPPAFADTGQLAAQLRRLVAGGPRGPVGAGTPCLRQARQLATTTAAVTVRSPSYAEAVRLGGVGGQVFVFSLGGGYVAVVVRTASCTLLATVAV